MKRFYWLLVLFFLIGCGSETQPTAVAPTTDTTTETVAVEVVPSATAVPPQATSTRRPTMVSPTPAQPDPRPSSVPPTATTVPTETAVPPNVPELVWLPYATGNFGEPVLMKEDGELETQPLPVAVEIYFDYEAGWLAYGGTFWEATADQQSVTDLHLYNFATGEDEVWAEQVGRADITPQEMLVGPPSVAVAVHNAQGFDLVLMRGLENRTVLAEDIDPYFSWSPDGNQIAYLRDNALFVTEAASDFGNPPLATEVYATSGWIGDAPLWLGDSGYLLYADAPFTIVAVDGSETIVPTAVDGNALAGGRPFALFYSATNHQLIAESEGMFGSSVAIYQLSDGFATAEIIEQFDDAQIVGWHEENASIILVSSGEPTVFPLTPPG